MENGPRKRGLWKEPEIAQTLGASRGHGGEKFAETGSGAQNTVHLRPEFKRTVGYTW